MAAPTLFRRLVVAQVLGSCALVLVFGGAFYADRNRTIARLSAERWAPALRSAAGLGAAAPAALPAALAVRVADAPPPGAVTTNAWAPRIATLRETLRADGVPAGAVAFEPGAQRPLTWIEVRGGDGRVRWLGIDDDILEPHVFRRLLFALALGFVLVSAASALVARRLTRPLETLRRRIESHDATASPWTGDALAPAPGDSDDSAGTTATLEIATIESAWRALSERLERQESERALLLAGVSHDLRSPLARIRMAAELLPQSDGVAQRRASIVRNVDVADRLIASFLDYVRAIELPLTATVDAVAVARRLVEARDQPPELLAVVGPQRLDLPHCHELLLERLLANLVDNALRHGRPPVLVRLAADGDTASIEVEDHGPGIPAGAQSRLLQAFARGDASRGTPGTGLGLAVVQQIVRRMGGVLSFEGGNGPARVRVRLPAR